MGCWARGRVPVGLVGNRTITAAAWRHALLEEAGAGALRTLVNHALLERRARELGIGVTQAMLARAFRGELVPTEADLARAEGRPYEPASALLARIRPARIEQSLIAQKTSRTSGRRGSSPIEVTESK